MENYLDIIGAMCGSNESGGGNPEEVLAEANAYTDEKVLSESTIRTNSDTNLQSQISALQAASDVVDIVGTYADLANYPTSGLTNNDVIKVLRDETQGNYRTYYRYINGTFYFIDSEIDQGTNVSVGGVVQTFFNADTKVDKVNGKGLSTNDFTTAEKNKLSGIATGAEVNVQSDWNTAVTGADSYIANKPNIFKSSTYGGVTIGASTNVAGSYATAEGYGTMASGIRSHAEGEQTTTLGSMGHAEGSSRSKASSVVTDLSSSTENSVILEAWATRKFALAKGGSSHSEGTNTLALGLRAHSEGCESVASGEDSHAEGGGSVASGMDSHAEGGWSVASGENSHAEGGGSVASGENSHAEGGGSVASGEYSHAEGGYSDATASYAHAEGFDTTASAENSHAGGKGTVASNNASTAIGRFNAAMEAGDSSGTVLAIGNGVSAEAKSNAFSVAFDGTVKAAGTITASTTADYAENFEWLDGNTESEDRVGHFVTLDGDKIRIAQPDDEFILGIVSGAPFVLGNGDCDVWNGMYLRDDFGRLLTEPAPKVIRVEVLDTDGNITGYTSQVVEGEFEGERFVLNPEYDASVPYISRADRVEWSPVGMLGVLSIIDDDSCVVNGYCTVGVGGTAVACDRGTENSYRVLKRVSDNIVRVLFR